MQDLILHSYFRSSAAYRVRIALNLKGLQYRLAPVNLLVEGGEQHSPQFRALNPQGLVPVLVHKGQRITQSLAIVEYLEEIAPEPPLLPQETGARAYVRALAQLICCDIHPLQNLRVRQYLEHVLKHEPATITEWQRVWIGDGLRAFERILADDQRYGHYCFGDRPTLADACLIPQLYNAKRVGCDFAGLPIIQAIDARCSELSEFRTAAPEAQPDACQ